LALVPITIGLTILVHLSGVGALPHVDRFCFVVVVMNLILLVFNLLPVYPLDGGQILQALLWFLMGRANSLLVSGILGLVGAGGLFLLASLMQSSWGMILAVFVGFQALAGVRQAFVLFRIQPGLDHLNRALDLVRQGEGEKALDECDRALELFPQGHRACAEAHACRALALAALDDHAGAVAGYSEALRRIPDSASYYLNRGVSHSRQGHYDLALEDYGMALKLAPQSPMALNNLAWLWATCPDPHFRDGARAVEYARRACTLRGREMPTFLSTLAAAYAEVGNFAEAIACLEKALENPRYDREHGVQARQRIQLYEAEQPFREEPTTRANHKPAL
jgi:tetratricopeptide (TPR) repeat protein